METNIRLTLALQEEDRIGINVADPEQTDIDCSDIVRVLAEEYNGSYEVTPSVYEQYLPTADKYLTRDVNVHKITYSETSNDTGTTVYIANE